MCDEAVDDFRPTLNFVPDWFVTSKIIKKLFMSILNIHLNCINLDNNNLDEDDSGTIIHVRVLAWHTKFEKHKALKKELNEELMTVVWHPNR